MTRIAEVKRAPWKRQVLSLIWGWIFLVDKRHKIFTMRTDTYSDLVSVRIVVTRLLKVPLLHCDWFALSKDSISTNGWFKGDTCFICI